MKRGSTHRRTAVAFIAIEIVLLVTACSSSSSTTTTTTTMPKNLSVSTPAGQVSLSLNGQLPPNWPAGFPVPSGATPAGSGSLGDQASTTLVGVYKTSTAPNTTFDFYKNNASLKVTSITSVGARSTFVGSLKMAQPPTGTVTVVGEGSSTLIVVVLNTTGTAASSTTASTITSQ